MAEELNRKDVEEIRNLRQAETEITKELVSLREKLTTLSRADVLNLSESANIQSRILTIMHKITKNMQLYKKLLAKG